MELPGRHVIGDVIIAWNACVIIAVITRLHCFPGQAVAGYARSYSGWTSNWRIKTQYFALPPPGECRGPEIKD
jgi:hypothetical protein